MFRTLILSIGCFSILPSVYAVAPAPTLSNSEQQIYVDAARGHDTNIGDQSNPFQTIRQALTKVKNTPTHIYLMPGIYREGELQNQSSSSGKVILESQSPGKSILSGTEILTNWRSTENSSQFQTNYQWPESMNTIWNQGECKNPSGWPAASPIAFRREMMFLDGQPLTQVLSMDDMRERTFFIQYDSDSNSNHAQVFIKLDNGIDPNHSQVEISAHDHALKIHSTSDWKIHGITSRGYGGCINKDGALSIYKSDRITVTGNQFMNNNSSGLTIFGQTPIGLSGIASEEGATSTEDSRPGISSSNVTVSNNLTEFNGFQGISIWGAKDLKVASNEVYFNGIRAGWAGYYSFLSAGVKMGLIHGGEIHGNSSRYNVGHGIWIDTDNENMDVSENVMTDNFMDGGRIEVSQGPISLRKNIFCFNNSSGNPWLKSSLGGGLEMDDSSNIEASDNVFYQNFYSQVFQSESPRSWTNFETLENYRNIVNNNIHFNQNKLKGFDQISSYIFAASYGKNPEEWPSFLKSFSDSGNAYWSRQDPNGNAFAMVDAKPVNWKDWKTASAVSNSTYRDFDDSRFKTCAFSIPNEVSDFQFLIYRHSVTSTWDLDANRENDFEVHVGIRPLHFFGDVTLSIGKLPDDITAQLSSTNIRGGNGTVTLQVHTTSHLAKGFYSIPLFAQTAQLPTHEASVNVSIQ